MRAFVLSGGASLGAIQAGMLEALYEHGIEPELIVGASAGALNCAYIASRPQQASTARELGAIWCKLSRGELFPLGPLSSLRAIVWGDHLASDRGLRALLERYLQFDRLQDAPLPLHLVAVDALTGREVLLSEGPALDAVLASAAIPGVLAPVRWGGMELIDGGVANNTPISHAVALGADEVYVLPTVLPTGDACALLKAPRGALGAVMHAMTLLVQHRLIDDIESFGHRVRLVVIPPPCPLAIQPTDFRHAEWLIAEARSKASGFLDAPDSQPGGPKSGRKAGGIATRASRRRGARNRQGARTQEPSASASAPIRSPPVGTSAGSERSAPA